MKNPKYKKFVDIGFDDFKKFAEDDNLSLNEKIGFPDDYRKGYEASILKDIDSKIGLINSHDEILDIGPGCSKLTLDYIAKASKSKASLTLVDSDEMLSLLPDLPNVRKVPGFYPSDEVMACLGKLDKFDKIICYSVLHYIFIEANIWNFLDLTLDLLKPGGKFLLADIPNFSMRNRFFASDEGKEFYKRFINSKKKFNLSEAKIDSNQIDDGILIGMILHARNRGFHGYIIPQDSSLPMSNRREDLLFIKP